jgi:putative transposase
MIDIYSRYIVGHKVATTESAVLAEEFIVGVFAVHGVPRVVHAGRGTSMISKKVADLLARLADLPAAVCQPSGRDRRP